MLNSIPAHRLNLNFRYEWRLDFMNTNQYTQKTLEALQAAQQLAVEYQHNALEPEDVYKRQVI